MQKNDLYLCIRGPHSGSKLTVVKSSHGKVFTKHVPGSGPLRSQRELLVFTRERFEAITRPLRVS